MPLSTPQSIGQRLDSWKEIAAYLERDVRTVRRWEKERGLPVHRVPGGERGAVFAYRAEVDVWLKGAGNKAAGDGPSAAASPVSVELGPDAVGLGVARPAINISGQAPAVAAWPGRYWAAVTLLCGLAVGGYWLWHSWYGGPAVDASFVGNSLVARNRRGEVSWTYPFSEPLDPNADNLRQRIAIVDLGPDRKGDVLAAVPFAVQGQAKSPGDALYCFSSEGKLRWRHSFNDTLRFGENEYGPPWVAMPPSVISGKRLAIWAGAREADYSPSALVELDRDGHRLAQFVNWGHIAVVGHVRNSSGSFILAGGISNQCDCAMLAVLEEDAASGSSPPLGPAYNCENCPPGRPYRYFLFPRSELTQLSGAAYNNVKLIRVEGGRVKVFAQETYNREVPGPDWIKYELSDSLVPQSFTVSDHFWTQHRQFEVEGKLHHTVEQCPERTHPRKVRMWSAERGWEEIAVPVSTQR